MAPANRIGFAGTNETCNYTVRVGLIKPEVTTAMKSLVF